MEKERLAAEQAEVEAERKELEELRRFKAEQEAKRNPPPTPAPQPSPEPEPLPAAAELNEPEWIGANLTQEPETVTISRAEYDQLLADQAKLRALEAMGVDNWSGYSDAMEQLAA